MSVVRFIALSIFMALSLPDAALACSVPEQYRPATTRELVRQADVIVLADVVGGKYVDMSKRSEVIVQPTMLLKGGRLPQPFNIEGILSGTVISVGSERIEIGPATPSNPEHLLFPNPETGGMCNRETFNKGMTLLLFMKKSPSGMAVINDPFTRTFEDVPSINAPWVRAVKVYIAINDFPKDTRARALAVQISSLRKSGNVEDVAVADALEWDDCGQYWRRFRDSGTSTRCAAILKKADAEFDAQADSGPKYRKLSTTERAVEPSSPQHDFWLYGPLLGGGILFVAVLLIIYRKRS